MFAKFIADIQKKSGEEQKNIGVDLQRIVATQSSDLMNKLKDIEAMSVKETYELLRDFYSLILADIFGCNNKAYSFLLTSPKFLTILIQVVNEVNLSHDECVHCNKFIYEYIVYADQDEYVRKLLFMLGEAVNKSTVRKLLGCEIDEELAIFLAVAHKSTFKEEVNIKRLNFTLATSNPSFMTVQRIIDIYQVLFTRISKLFTTTMFDIGITSEDAWVTKEILDANNNITWANLYILESMEPIEITRVLLTYAEEFKMVHAYNYNAVRYSMHNLTLPTFIKTPILIKQLEGDDILIP